MAIQFLPKSIQKLLIVGPIYNKIEKLKEIEKLLPEYDWVVFNDSISFSDNLNHSAKSQIEQMDRLLASGKVTYVVGNQDLNFASSSDLLNPDHIKIESWIRSKPNVVMADFNGRYQIVVVSGGIPSHVTSVDKLTHNMEVSFATHPHQTYTGGLGYIICNLPLTKWAPVYYRYSVQIGNTWEGQVYALSVNPNGVQRTILV